ncbi:glycoside hydrolase family 3 protein [Phenylobacterium deserti]|uniref:1,4-beta-D-glucan glucohydrolase n=1 Tax=Phenylobacterium deserti TaxID=1914756 RepID=A0A328AQK0_9CAUL|nr:exo 1,3/1,4-beta-D-glucan glucohydrolase [Phenylobacterium deserti]RAK56887.1 1,4-beta-D-glucan glucohydrolase [Phenylobacterium deserti]
MNRQNSRRGALTFAAAAALLTYASTWTGAVAQTPAAPAANAGVAHPELWPAAKSQGLIDPKTEAAVTELMSKMTVEEKVGQLIQGDIGSIRPEDLKQYPVGSILAGGSSPPLNSDDRSPAQPWLDTARAFRAASMEARPGHTPIPVIFGVDAVHGNNNIVGATLFPHNIGLGAMRNPALVQKIGEATAIEAAATGIDWAFGPTLAVVQDDRWGRTYESYSEDPEVVASYAGPMVTGLQGPISSWPSLANGRVAASAKHFLGDGGTQNGRDQGDNRYSEQDLARIHGAGYPPAINAGTMTVMASFSSWQGVKMHGNQSLLTDVLKGRMGFDGFVISDWEAHGQVPGCTETNCPQAITAGIDMVMASNSWKGLYTNTLAQVKSGQIPMARVDDAVRRILRVKYKLGLFGPRPLEGKLDLVGAPEHRAIARQAVRESLVLLKNNGSVLPIKAGAKVLVAGDGADDVGKQSGGWTLSWQGTGNSPKDFPGATSIYKGIQEAVSQSGGKAELSADGSFKTKPDVAIVVFGEDPYAEFQGDIANLDYKGADQTDLALLKKLKAQGIPVVSVFITGRPLWVNPELNASDAFVAAWLPGSEGGGVADVLIGDAAGKPRHDFKGKLSFSWPKRADQYRLNRNDPGYDPLFAYGYGLTYADKTRVAQLSEVSGVTATSNNPDRYFVGGRFAAPWRLALRDAGGETIATTASASSPRRAVSVAAVDANGVQEAGRALTFTGAGQATAAVTGPSTDLSRQANGDLALLLQYRVDQKPTAPVQLNIGTGKVSLDKVLADAPVGQWQTVRVKLSCVRSPLETLTEVTTPFAIQTSGQLKLSLGEAQLVPNQNNAICP